MCSLAFAFLVFPEIDHTAFILQKSHATFSYQIPEIPHRMCLRSCLIAAKVMWFQPFLHGAELSSLFNCRQYPLWLFA
jgi:hypothetical protein